MASHTQTENGENTLKASDQVTPSTDLEKGANDLQHALPEEETRPGAKAGLSLRQFWIVMFGYALLIFFI